MNKKQLIENIDFYIENNKYIFTELYLLKRKKCCKNLCRHCPYEYLEKMQSIEIK